jgi:hypothetical protein
MVAMNLYLCSDQAAETAARETPLWQAWIQNASDAVGDEGKRMISVLAFSVSGRTRGSASGWRSARAAQPAEGVIARRCLIGVASVVAGALGGFGLTRLLGNYLGDVKLPGALPVVGSAIWPRSWRRRRRRHAPLVNVMQALRSE